MGVKVGLGSVGATISSSGLGSFGVSCCIFVSFLGSRGVSSCNSGLGSFGVSCCIYVSFLGNKGVSSCSPCISCCVCFSGGSGL